MKKKEKSRSAASFDAQYTTYEDMKPKKLPLNLVDLRIEDFLMVEVGGWGTTIKILTKQGTKTSLCHNPNGTTTVVFTPPASKKSSLMSVPKLSKNIAKILAP